jgi:hypothetical protein
MTGCGQLGAQFIGGDAGMGDQQLGHGQPHRADRLFLGLGGRDLLCCRGLGLLVSFFLPGVAVAFRAVLAFLFAVAIGVTRLAAD